MNAVIARYVAAGSYIHTDCNDLNSIGYVHLTVNQSEKYLDPDTGALTNDIEGARNSIKEPCKRMRGNRQHVQSHLDEASWRMFRSAAINPEACSTTSWKTTLDWTNKIDPPANPII